MNYQDFKKKLLQDPKFRKEYYKRDLTFDIANMIIEARINKGFSQKKLAKLMKTEQPSIARVERGNCLPSLRFLEKMAKAMRTYLIIPRFAFLEKEEISCIFSAENTEDVKLVAVL